MRTILLAATAFAAVICFAAPASACLTTVYRDPATGEEWSEDTPRGKALDQAWARANSSTMFVAQVSQARLAGHYDLDLTFTPVQPLHGGVLPDTSFTMKRIRSQICEKPFAIGDFAVIYAVQDDGGWSMVSLIPAGDLQDQPAEYQALLERMTTGFLAVPDYPE